MRMIQYIAYLCIVTKLDTQQITLRLGRNLTVIQTVVRCIEHVVTIETTLII